MQTGWNHRLLCDSDDCHCTGSIPVLKMLFQVSLISSVLTNCQISFHVDMVAKTNECMPVYESIL